MTGPATSLNSTQLYLLKLFSCNPSEETMSDIRKMLTDYYAKKIDEESQKVWDRLELTPEKLDEYCSAHKRVSCNESSIGY